MDIGTNRVPFWKGVSSVIDIEKGKVITITPNNEESGNHFQMQSIHGTVTSINPCNTGPAEGMQIITVCS